MRWPLKCVPITRHPGAGTAVLLFFHGPGDIVGAGELKGVAVLAVLIDGKPSVLVAVEAVTALFVVVAEVLAPMAV